MDESLYNKLNFGLTLIVNACHYASSKAGWWQEPINIPEKIALIHSELLKIRITEQNETGELHMKQRTWLDKQLENSRNAVGAWSEQKRAALKAQISGSAGVGFRRDRMDDHLPNRKAIEVELADAIHRICDLASFLELDLGSALVAKMKYNAQREDHKPENRAKLGGKKF